MKKAVLISGFGWYERRLEPVKQILNEKYEVLVVLSDFLHISKKPVENKMEDCIYIHVPTYKKNLSLNRMFSHLIFAKSVFNLLKKEKPDLIYALIPPNGVATACKEYKRKNPSTKIVFDIIDLWPESIPMEGVKKTPPFKMWKNLRDKSLPFADYVFTECRLYQNILGKKITTECETLHLFKEDSGEGKNSINKIFLVKEEENNNLIKLGYVGSINYIIDIESILVVIKTLKKRYKVIVNIIGDGEKREHFIEKIKEVGAEVNYYGKIYDEKRKMDILGKCDYGLNLMIEKVKVGLTIKSLDYFSYGLPIINNIKGDTWEIIENKEIGVNFNGDTKDFLARIKINNREIHMRTLDTYNEYFTKNIFENKIEKMLEKIY